MTAGLEGRRWSSLACWSWQTLPRRAGRVSPTLMRLLLDGAYVSAVPWLGALLPPMSYVLGFVAGDARPGFADTGLYTASPGMLAAAIALAVGCGAGCGLRFWIGYVVGDLGHRLGGWLDLAATAPEALPTHIGRVVLVLYLLYLLLALVPFLGRNLGIAAAEAAASRLGGRTRAEGDARDGPRDASPGLRTLASAAATALGVWAWAGSAPLLARPYFAWIDFATPPDAALPLREAAWALAVMALVVALVRAGFEESFLASAAGRRWAASVREGLLARPAARPRGRWRAGASGVARAAWSTFVVAGLLTNAVQAAVAFLAFLALPSVIAAGGSILRRALPLRERVPFAPRLVLGLGAGAAAAASILHAPWVAALGLPPPLAAVLAGSTILLLVAGKPGRAPGSAAAGGGGGGP